MAKQDFKELLNEVVCRVMEQMAFVFPEPADLSDGVAFDDIELLLTSLSFKGDKEGQVSLIVPVEFCMELSANLLGKDIAKAGTREEYGDAVKEILNIITGQLLIRLFGEEVMFNLTAPEIKDISGEEIFPLIENNVYSFSMADDHPIIATLTLAEKAHEHKGINC